MSEKFDPIRFAALEARVEALEKGRSGRKAKPILVSAENVCALDPTRDSAECPDASLYRRNQGCLGKACFAASSQYYKDRRKADG